MTSRRTPGLDRSIFGNGLSTIISGFFGSTPNTTYGENIGVLAITKVFSTLGHRWRGRLCHPALVPRQARRTDPSIPTPVMGGVSMLLFGVIASPLRHPHPRRGESRLQQPNEPALDVHRHAHRRLDGQLTIGTVSFKGMSLATVVAIILSLAFRLIAMVRGDKTPLVGQKAEDSTHQ